MLFAKRIAGTSAAFNILRELFHKLRKPGGIIMIWRAQFV